MRIALVVCLIKISSASLSRTQRSSIIVVPRELARITNIVFFRVIYLMLNIVMVYHAARVIILI
jgi:hypothetical protein